MVDEWRKVLLGDVATLQRGFDLPSQNRKPGKVPIVSSSGICDYHSESAVKGPGVVTGRYGTIGQVFLIKEDYWPLNTTLWVKDFHGNNPVYVSYLLRTIDFQSCSDKSSVPGVNRNDLHRIPVLLPPHADQNAMAAVLGALDDKIELNRQMNVTLEAMARALFQSWFMDFDPVRAKLDGRPTTGMDAATAALFPASFQESKLGTIPAAWTIEQVGNAVTCVGGATPSTTEARYWEGGAYHWTTPKDFSSLQAPVLIDTERRLTDAGVAKISSGLLPPGTLLLSSRAPVGYLALAAIPVAINQGFIAIKCNQRVSNYFMLNWCRANMTEIESRATGTTFAEISKQNFRPIPIVLPPVEIMTAFTKAVAPFYERIIANLYESRTLASLRDALLPRLLSGEIRVPAASAPNVVAFPSEVPVRKATDEFVEAVVIARLVKLLATPEFPLGRFRYNKLAYFAHRKAADDTTKHYLKKAAGPYSPWAKYSGPEAIAKRNKYVCEARSGERQGLVPAEKIADIDQYQQNHPVYAAVDWVAEHLRYRRKDDLERLATVDFAAVELQQQCHSVTLEGIKRVIAANPEWAPKLQRDVFSDENIASALVELAETYPTLYKA